MSTCAEQSVASRDILPAHEPHPRSVPRSAAGRVDTAKFSANHHRNCRDTAAAPTSRIRACAAIERTAQNRRGPAATVAGRKRVGILRGLHRCPPVGAHWRWCDHRNPYRPGIDRDRPGRQPRRGATAEGIPRRQGSVRHQPAHGDALRRWSRRWAAAARRRSSGRRRNRALGSDRQGCEPAALQIMGRHS